VCDDLCDCDAMKRHERFLPVLDSQKHRIRGLIRRADKFYAQMRVMGPDGKSRPVRVPLEATSLDAARKELEKKRTENRTGKMHAPGHRPTFEKLVAEYEQSAEFLGKKESTRENETQALNRWIAHLGGVRIDRISADRMTNFRDIRRAEGVNARTINLDMIAFGNAMQYALAREWLSVVPRLKKLKEDKPPKRTLLSPDDIERLLGACVPTVTKNAQELGFYIRFLVLTGAREQEALNTRWTDVDFGKEQVTIGATGDTKNRRFRSVNMSAELRGLMREMEAQRPPDSSFLFPSPQRGPRDVPAQTLRGSFKLVRSKAGMDHVGFHDFRHFFASTCVMAGIDFMTVASWLGHSDGGVLVGKVYGHLADEHKRRMADNLFLLKSPANVVRLEAGRVSK
jgi:integrase